MMAQSIIIQRSGYEVRDMGSPPCVPAKKKNNFNFFFHGKKRREEIVKK